MTADDLKMLAKKRFEHGLGDLQQKTLVDGNGNLVHGYEPLEAVKVDPQCPRGPDVTAAEVTSSILSCYLKLHAEDRVAIQELTPDQWLVLIALIGDIILKIIERRNPRPTP